jgi:hypothetical protein
MEVWSARQPRRGERLRPLAQLATGGRQSDLSFGCLGNRLPNTRRMGGLIVFETGRSQPGFTVLLSFSLIDQFLVASESCGGGSMVQANGRTHPGIGFANLVVIAA